MVATEVYYKTESEKFISENSVPDYMKKVITRLGLQRLCSTPVYHYDSLRIFLNQIRLSHGWPKRKVVFKCIFIRPLTSR